MNDQSFAIFGGVDPDQIVGGLGGLKKIQTMAYRPDWTQSSKQWALEGQNMFYGTEECQKIGEEKKYAAIIDTGSSNIGVPDTMFKSLQEKWRKSFKELDCVTDDNFCQLMTPCDQVAAQLKPISFQISNQVFELPSEQYLHQAEGKRCQFAIHSNQLKGSSANLILIGDILLRHLYQVYDFENEAISLGLNKHSVGKILMYEAGNRPEDAPKIQLDLDMVGASSEIQSRFNAAGQI
uniref:Peptidase A1 domain-containing protein n=1 Tax=Strombidium rassoulzadegani TaxID=1082188 RepID=A0A7S3FSR3_9SPIT|mmetsp:Transcript_12132/g.20465  ORF Transcript_12132/g.20465 Transcript_12132/m.20465 type:complete len:237 (+) Transcript_12132:97-807(+)